LCNISDLSFAVGFSEGTIKIYSKNNKKYQSKDYKIHIGTVKSLLYLPQQNLLLSGSDDKTINIFSLSEEKSIKRLIAQKNWVTSLILLNDETFASGSNGFIKIWSIKEKTRIEISFLFINIIKASEYPDDIYLNILGNDFIVSKSYGAEFKIWDVKNYECIKTVTGKDDSSLVELIVTKNKNTNIITVTKNNKINLWKISL
jgi:WD40 repeat protein